MRADKFMLAYNLFVSLHESAFDVEYGLADIQGNTFETMTGKPFIDLRPIPVIHDQEVIANIKRNWEKPH